MRSWGIEGAGGVVGVCALFFALLIHPGWAPSTDRQAGLDSLASAEENCLVLQATFSHYLQDRHASVETFVHPSAALAINDRGQPYLYSRDALHSRWSGIPARLDYCLQPILDGFPRARWLTIEAANDMEWVNSIIWGAQTQLRRSCLVATNLSISSDARHAELELLDLCLVAPPDNHLLVTLERQRGSWQVTSEVRAAIVNQSLP